MSESSSSASSASESALRATAAAWLACARAAVIVEVLSHRGSVPRETGTRMLVATGDGADSTAGTIGGGHLEWQAISHARAGRTTPWSVALGPSLGQCCGGALTLAFVPLSAAALASWPTTPPRLEIELYGAGHVGRAIVQLLTGLDVRVRWIDQRDDAFPTAALPSSIEALCAEPIEAEVAAAPPGACHLVLTHSHDLDLRLTEAILWRGDFRWLGLIGSATKRARFMRRLAERGVPADALARLTCPIGLPGVGGKAPAEIAIAVVAQLLALPSEP
ncbi:MAG: xanthine dehydrogenase accessory protein XdhC, partial [Rubrivivax sp.]